MYYYIVSSGSKGNATIIKDKDIVILIDMGIAFSRFEEEINKINLSMKDVNAAFFTHNHTDHISGLKFIPIKKQYALKGTLPSSGHNELDLFEPINIGHLKVTPIKASHDAINPCGYLIENEEERLVYITDTGIFPEENFNLIKNPDYLIIESNHDIQMLMKTNRPMQLKQRILSELGHLNNEDSALAALEIIGKKTKDIVLAHLSEEANTPEKALEAYQRVFSYFSKDVNKYNLRCANQWTPLLGGSYED